MSIAEADLTRRDWSGPQTTSTDHPVYWRPSTYGKLIEVWRGIGMSPGGCIWPLEVMITRLKFHT